MSTARLCPTCYAGTPPEATHCWMCRSPLPPFEQRPLPTSSAVAHLERPVAGTPNAAPPPALQRTSNERIAIAVAALAGMLALALVAFELIRFAPGLLVLLALFAVPVLALVMGVVIYQTRSAPKTGPTVASPTAASDETKEQVATFVGMMVVGVGWVLIAVASLFLTMLAAMILFFIICFGIVAVSSGLH